MSGSSKTTSVYKEYDETSLSFPVPADHRGNFVPGSMCIDGVYGMDPIHYKFIPRGMAQRGHELHERFAEMRGYSDMGDFFCILEKAKMSPVVPVTINFSGVHVEGLFFQLVTEAECPDDWVSRHAQQQKVELEISLFTKGFGDRTLTRMSSGSSIFHTFIHHDDLGKKLAGAAEEHRNKRYSSLPMPKYN